MNKQKEFRKLFGRYKASDVDRYLLELGEETEKRMAGIENLRQAAEQESQLLRTQAEKERQERVALEEKLGQAAEGRRLEQMNAESLRKEIRTLEKQLAGIREEKQKCLSENRRLQTELEKALQQQDALREELGFAQLQSEQLGQRAASQRLEIERMEKMIEANPMADASLKAQKIVQEAVDASQKMLDDAENIRTQATAAVRAAYFNAMGFRQVIEERFVNLQHELDKSMGSLRMLQSPGDYPVYVSGEKNE